MDTKKSGPGSFWIPKQAIELLMKSDSWPPYEMATATQISVYLVLASHTDETGQFSTVGVKKVAEATGASKGYPKKPGQAQKAIDRLIELGGSDSKPKRKKGDPLAKGEGYDPSQLERLIYTAEDYTRMTGIELPEIPGLHEVRYVVNTFGADMVEDGIWFDRKLIEGTGHFKNPLKRLIGCGDYAARLLLKLHEIQTYTYMDFGGVQPSGAVYRKHKTHHIETGHGFTYYTAEDASHVVFQNVSLPVLGIKGFSLDEYKKGKEVDLFFDALKALESTGFVDEVMTVFNNDPEKEDAQPVYEITVKNQHGNIVKGDEPFLFLKRLDNIFEHNGLKEHYTDKSGRHTQYPVISRVGVKPHVAGVLRCRFRPRNWKQFTVKEVLDLRQGLRQEWDAELKLLEGSLGMNKPKPVRQDEAKLPTNHRIDENLSMSDMMASLMGENQQSGWN